MSMVLILTQIKFQTGLSKITQFNFKLTLVVDSNNLASINNTNILLHQTMTLASY